MNESYIISKIQTEKEINAMINIIYKELSKYMTVEVKSEYQNQAISIRGELNDEQLNGWIRLAWYRDKKFNTKCDFGVSNICLPEHLRHKGIFTGIIKSISKLKYVDTVTIMSVLTPEMMEWCNKYGLVHISEMDYRMYCKNRLS